MVVNDAFWIGNGFALDYNRGSNLGFLGLDRLKRPLGYAVEGPVFFGVLPIWADGLVVDTVVKV
jgi:hypothetical protein